jgi:hypothetical protein
MEKFAISWINKATKEVSYLKGELLAFYWEREFTDEVIIFCSRKGAEMFASMRINVPYEIKDVMGLMPVC